MFHSLFHCNYPVKINLLFWAFPSPSSSAQTRDVQETVRRWCGWWFRLCSSTRKSCGISTHTSGVHTHCSKHENHHWTLCRWKHPSLRCLSIVYFVCPTVKRLCVVSVWWSCCRGWRVWSRRWRRANRFWWVCRRNVRGSCGTCSKWPVWGHVTFLLCIQLQCCILEM